LGPFKKLRYIYDDLAVRCQLQARAIHRTRRRSFIVNPFTVVSAAVAGTLEFVLAGSPTGRAAKVRASRVNHEKSVRRAIHPDAVLLLPFCIDTEGIVRWKTDFENGGRFEKRAGKEKAQKGDKPGAQKTGHGTPNQTA